MYLCVRASGTYINVRGELEKEDVYLNILSSQSLNEQAMWPEPCRAQFSATKKAMATKSRSVVRRADENSAKLDVEFRRTRTRPRRCAARG